MRVLFLVLVLVGMVGVGAAAPKKMKPMKASLKKVELKQPLPFSYQLPEGRKAAEKQHALVGKVSKRKLTLVDVDGDGRFDEEGVDGWQIGNYAYLLPFEQPLIFGYVLVRIKIHKDGKSLLWTAGRMLGNGLHLRELAIINGIRMRNGLPPASYSKELSQGCRLHCRYMASHGLTHAEDRSKPEYTDAGAEAGRNSNVAMGWMGAGVGAFRQFYHRRTVAQPSTREMGFGMAGAYCCVDGLSGQTERSWQWPVIIPAPGTSHHTISYDHGEMPAPVPPGPPAGMPITLRWPQYTSITSAKAALFDAKGKKLKAWVSWPGKPANKAAPGNNDSICIIPAYVLKPGATYRVEVKAEVDGKPYERTFEFTTSKRTKV